MTAPTTTASAAASPAAGDDERQLALSQLVAQLQLEQLEHNLFRGPSHDFVGSRAVFGGQVLGQALMAAARTVQGHTVHSLHGYFLRPGDKNAPIVYDVDRIRDGTSFTTRRVVAIQHGQAIFHMSASFQQHEEGVEHQRPMPPAPPPEGLAEEFETRKKVRDLLPPDARAVLERARPIDFRPTEQLDALAPAPAAPYTQAWLRAAGELSDDPLLHQALLAYASDIALLRVAMVPHGLSFYQPGLQVASLDHAMWFHRDFRFDDWLLYEAESPSAQNARGFCRGSIYSRDGRLVASVAQEGLIRKR